MREELYNLAQEIANAEKIISSSTNSEDKRAAEKKITELSNNISLDELFELDEIIQTILNK